MGRHTEAVCRLCRREKEKLYLKGDRCFTDKCAVVRHAYPPGEHGQGRQKARSKKLAGFMGFLKGSFVVTLKRLIVAGE